MLLIKFFSLFFIISFLACGVKKPPIAPQNSEEKIIESEKTITKKKLNKTKNNEK